MTGVVVTTKHRVFISFHHKNDENYKICFEQLFHNYSNAVLSHSVQDGDISPLANAQTTREIIRTKYLRDTTVTIVLIGSEIWKRKHVDWEISSSIRHTSNNYRSGLIGILLPTYPRQDMSRYNPYTIPPRLYYNIKCGYANIYNWSEDPTDIQQWVHDAYLKRGTHNPDLSFPMFTNNKFAEQWSPVNL
jgi:hypothetical protein